MGDSCETRATPLRLGEILVSQGVLSQAQVQVILDTQRSTSTPFGVLAERLYDVPPAVVQEAWVRQYLSYGTEVRLASQALDPAVRAVLHRRQAWQFGLVPLRREDGCLVLATSRADLPRAVRFAWGSLAEPVYFVVLTGAELDAALARCYPCPAMQALRRGAGGRRGGVTVGGGSGGPAEPPRPGVRHEGSSAARPRRAASRAQGAGGGRHQGAPGMARPGSRAGDHAYTRRQRNGIARAGRRGGALRDGTPCAR